MKNILTLTDSDIESAIPGHSDIALIRRIIANTIVNITNIDMIDEDAFADEFANAIQSFITEEPDTVEYEDAWNENWHFGLEIAQSINDLIIGDENGLYNT
jgi:hypothetical protein